MPNPVPNMTVVARRERRRKVAAALGEGRAVSDVCHAFGVSPATAAESWREFGTGRRPGPRHEPGLTAYTVIALLCTTTLGVCEIARRTNRSHARVQQIRDQCVAAGVPVKPRPPSKFHARGT